jgi:hypothetical protein
MLRFTTRDLLWLTLVAGMGCALGLSALYGAHWRNEAITNRRLADDRQSQLEVIFNEWQRQKPLTIKHTSEGKYIIKSEAGPPITIKP